MSIYTYTFSDNLSTLLNISECHDRDVSDQELSKKPKSTKIKTAWEGNKHLDHSKEAMSKAHTGMSKPWASKSSKRKAVRDKISKSLSGRKRPEMDITTMSLKGHDRTEAQKQASRKHSERLEGKVPNNAKAVVVDGTKYPSMSAAMKELRIGKIKLLKMLG